MLMETFWGTIVAVLGIFGSLFAIEKIPIKINPLTMIKKFLVGDLTEKIDSYEKKRVRARANEIKFELSNYEKLASNGIELSEDDIAFVRELYDEYHKELEQNHRGTIIYENIERMYKEQQEKKELQN